MLRWLCEEFIVSLTRPNAVYAGIWPDPDYMTWRARVVGFLSPSSPIPSRRASWRPFTLLWIRGKSVYSRVPLARSVCAWDPFITVSCECLRAFLCLILQGKSLSLICGALTWLRDYEQQKKQEAAKLLDGPEEKCDAVKEENSTSQTSEPDWVSEFVQKKAERDIVNKLKVWELLCASHSSSDQAMCF